METDESVRLIQGMAVYGIAAFLAGFALVYYRRGFRDGQQSVTEEEA